MARDPLSQITPRFGTSQREQAREDQVKNNAGGFVFDVNDFTRLERFLLLGTDGGTYYVKEADHTKDNARFVIELAQKNASDMVAQIRDVSVMGRAARQNSTLFALAAASVYGDDAGRNAAFGVVPQVVRTGSQLFQFITYREQMGGWGRGMRWAVGQAWYNLKDTEKLAYQMVKYRTRNNWSHRDALRLSHPKPVDDQHSALFGWAVGKSTEFSDSFPPMVIQAFEALQKATSVDEVTSIIGDDGLVSWEMIPDRFINDPKVWEALFRSGVPQTALIRQLPRLTRIGFFPYHNPVVANEVARQLTDPDKLKKARVHPVNLLIAQKTYAAGQGRSSIWTPNAIITDALDKAFYNAFGAVEPTNKRIMLALDVSGSMTSPIPGRDPREPLPISAREAAGALALVSAATEPNSFIVGFGDGTTVTSGEGNYLGRTWSNRDAALVTPLNISPRQRLDDVIKYMKRLNFTRTDLALPMLHALKEKIPIDAFVIYTDNETWYGNIHPYQALKRYREQMGINAKLVVVSLTATQFSIADPLDPGMMDVVGFDANVVTAITDFIRS